MAELDQAPGRQCEWLYGGCAMTTRMTRTLFPPLLGYATCGLVLSLALHPGSLAGVQAPGRQCSVCRSPLRDFPAGVGAASHCQKNRTGKILARVALTAMDEADPRNGAAGRSARRRKNRQGCY
jgi:hypothetical protein